MRSFSVRSISASAVCAGFLVASSARVTAGSCDGVATLAGGTTYMIVCITDCSIFGGGCHEVIQELSPTVAAVSCGCDGVEIPTLCCHTVVIYEPHKRPKPDAFGSCLSPCGGGGECDLLDGGDNDKYADCPDQ
jgi:hypothetical protein